MDRSPSKKYRVAIVGYGRMGENHAMAWAKIRDAELVGIVDPDEKKRKAAGLAFGCPVFVSVDDLFKNAKPDIVVVATQAKEHFSPVVFSLQQGCHVICEKPMASSLAEADDMIEEAKKSQRTLAIHHELVSNPAAVKARELIDNGKIGEFYFMEGFAKGRPAPYELTEEAIHMLHGFYFFAKSRPDFCFGHIEEEGKEIVREDLRPIEKIFPQGRKTGNVGAGDYIYGYYRFSNGICASLRLKTLDKVSNDYAALEFHGTKGRLRIHFSNHHSSTGRLFFKPTPQDDFKTLRWAEIPVGWWRDQPRRFLYARGIGEPFAAISSRRFAREFLDCLSAGTRPKVTGEDGKVALAMALSIYDSHFKKALVFFGGGLLRYD